MNSHLLSIENITIEPGFWWSGMKNHALQLMVYGTGIRSYTPTIDFTGVKIATVARLDNPNYLLIYLDISEALPGSFFITFTCGNKVIAYPYELKARREDASEIQGFDSSDVLYLIMPDRFACGTPHLGTTPMRMPYQTDRNDPNARHGGDLAGIGQHLDYLSDLGVTAIWLNPVLENDMEGGSYHGYATTNYYRVDPRLGTNDDYVQLVKRFQQKQMRVIMDMIFNHCGSDHPWMKEVPDKDWFNHLDQYVQTNHDKEVYLDPYASDYDRETLVKGWFAPSMPDLNQRNPHVARYLIQNSIWWIEYSRINGIRQDTYPYADLEMMTQWCREVMNEYPHFNIVGEAWINQTIGCAFWQKGSKLNVGKDTELKSVMDFKLREIAGKAFQEETEWTGGLLTIFEHMCYDFVYPDIYNVLRFLENHDTDRFLPEMPHNLGIYRQAIAFLLTIPGIPQIYYGQELLMHGSKEKGDGFVRKDIPGGWADDPVNMFEASGRSKIQNEAWLFTQKLLRWRRGNEVIAKGKMKHFTLNEGVYVYERRLNDKSILIIMNGKSKSVTIPLNRYAEVLHDKTHGKDIITNKMIPLDKVIRLSSRGILILEMQSDDQAISSIILPSGSNNAPS